ncbi:MAG: hypothetical protein O2894_07185 [Planctomycetota bacterium]|nr:hypothetical protein [Planctomycetota bacterium]
MQVVDAASGAPIEGALVRQHYEMDVGPDGWAPIAAERRTDAYGLAWVTVPPEERYDDDAVPTAHWAVSADGYAATEEYGCAIGVRVELVRPRRAHGRICDALGRPVVGMKVGYKEGCAHAPLLATATTDHDGRFVLDGVVPDVDVVFHARGVMADYFDGPLRPLDETPPTHAASPGRRFVGRLIGVDPSALGLRLVHAAVSSRGVFARVEDDGRFVLDSLAENPLITLWTNADGTVLELPMDDLPDTGSFTWDLTPAPTDVAEVGKAIEDVTLTLRLVTPEGRQPRPAHVSIRRARDGGEVALESWDDFAEDVLEPAPIEIQLPPDAYVLHVGTTGARWHAEPTPFELRADRTLDVQVTAWPRLDLEWIGLEPEDASSWGVAWANADGIIDHEAPDPENGCVPPRAEARVAVTAAGVTRWFDVQPMVGDARRARIEWPAPRRIRFRLAEPVRDAWIGDYEEDIHEIEDGYELRTQAEGRLRLVLLLGDPDDEWTDSRVVRMLDLTGPREAVIDLGLIASAPRVPGAFTWTDVDGQPIVDDAVTIEFDGVEVGQWDYDAVETDENGRAQSALLREGARVRREGDDNRRIHQLVGPGPWTVRDGGTALELEVHGPDGILSDAGVMLDGVLRTRDDPTGESTDAQRPARYRFHALAEGAHVLVVTAPGLVGEARGLVLGARERRRLVVKLTTKRPDGM